MPVRYIGKSSAMASDTVGISVAVPTGYAANDLLLLLLEGYDAAVQTPSGWTSLDTQSATNAYLRVCYKIAGSSESAVSVADSGDSTRGLMLCLRGADTQNPINVSTKGTSGTTAFSAGGVTTTVDECLVITAIGFYDADANDTSNYSSWANASLASITEGHDAATSAGLGGGIAFSYGIKLDAGTVGSTTATTDNAANYSAYILFAVAPANDGTTVIDSYSAENSSYDDWPGLFLQSFGQTFACGATAYQLTKARFYIHQGDTPTGTPVIRARLYAHSGTWGSTGIPASAMNAPLASSDTILWSNLPTANEWVDFNFSTPYTLSANTKYCIAIELDADATGTYVLNFDNTSPTHAGNTFGDYGEGDGWEAIAARDTPFQVRGTAVPSSYVKTIQGLAKASVKTAQGLMIVSVKSVQGLL